jgi:hypothetical protein
MLHVVTQVFNNNPISGQLPGTSEHWPSSYWLVVGLPIVIYLGIVGLLAMYGASTEKNPFRYFFGSISNSLERLTGFAGWAMAGALTGLMALLVAAMGLYWDVSWHVDFGRDKGTLFTPPHVTILAGLGGLIFAAAVTILFASLENIDTRLKFGAIRVPWGGLLFGVMGFLAVAAFPLDALWHDTYGIDVTLWSPTHLQLITGGSLGAFAVLMIFAEAWPSSKPNAHGRFWLAVACGAVLTAVSTYQGEFDFRVPQFQPVYLPILIMAGAGIALVFSRLVLGRWGAIKAVIAYLVIRTYLSGLVASLHHEFARFPLYLPSAVAVELAAWWVGTHNRFKFGAVAGVLIGTIGLAGETVWISASGWFAPAPQLLAKTLELAPITAVAAALIGAGLGRAFHRDSKPVPIAALGLAAVVLVSALMIPLPRDVGNVVATIHMTPIGNGDTAHVTVALQPTNAADNAVFFGVAAWQGGGTKRILLKETSPGLYTETAPVPVVGKWKSMVTLIKGNWDMAAPIYLPIDPAIHAPEIPAVPVRVTHFVRNTALLLREEHGGPAWPRELGYTGLIVSTVVFVVLIAAAAIDMDTEVDNDDVEKRSIWGSGFTSSQPRRQPQPAAWTPAPVETGARWNPGGLTGAGRR